MTLRRLPSDRRRGLVLIAVLVVVVMLSLAAYQYSELITAEYGAMASYTRTTQTRAFADSGVHYGAAMLADPFNVVGQLGNNPYDNPAAFQDVLVQDPLTEGGPRGLFSIITLPRPEELQQGATQQFRFGVSDENAKLNLNALLQYDRRGERGLAMLLQLPNMTEDTANALLDWLDADDTIRAGGAENETYSAMTPPYRCKNGALDSLEELLLVRGVTPYLLFGNDRNRNGYLDPDEDTGNGIDLGWQAYLTVFSVERNVDNYGEARINLMDQDYLAVLGGLDEAFPDNLEVQTFVLAYRLYGGQTPEEGAAAPPAPTEDDLSLVQLKVLGDWGRQRRSRMRSPWDMVNKNVTVSIRVGQQTKEIVLPCPFSDPVVARELMPVLFDRFTTRKSADLTPRINVATASQVVLAMLPDITPEEVQQIVAAQPVFGGGNTTESVFSTPTWLYTDAGLPASKLAQWDRYVTSRSQVYRFQVVGYFDRPGPISRAEAVIDGNLGRPRVVYWRDLTELGPGFPLGGNVPVE